MSETVPDSSSWLLPISTWPSFLLLATSASNASLSFNAKGLQAGFKSRIELIASFAGGRADDDILFVPASKKVISLAVVSSHLPCLDNHPNPEQAIISARLFSLHDAKISQETLQIGEVLLALVLQRAGEFLIRRVYVRSVSHLDWFGHERRFQAGDRISHPAIGGT